MTKEMALALAKQIDKEPYVDAQELVYAIYDYFENRTCESCKYCDDIGCYCTLDVFPLEIDILKYKVRGCSEFEKKQ